MHTSFHRIRSRFFRHLVAIHAAQTYFLFNFFFNYVFFHLVHIYLSHPPSSRISTMSYTRPCGSLHTCRAYRPFHYQTFFPNTLCTYIFFYIFIFFHSTSRWRSLWSRRIRTRTRRRRRRDKKKHVDMDVTQEEQKRANGSLCLSFQLSILFFVSGFFVLTECVFFHFTRRWKSARVYIVCECVCVLCVFMLSLGLCD